MANEIAIAGQNIPSIHEIYKDKAAFENIQRIAKMFSASDLVPNRFKNNIQNTVIALELAQRMNASAIMVMQNLYIVHGSPGWSGQFVIASINACGKFGDDLNYEWSGTEGKDDWGCRAITVDKKGKEKRGAKVTLSMAKAEGWYEKTGSKWKTMPEQMLMYRAASFFGRTFCPDVMNGMYTVEEIEDYTTMAGVDMDAYVLRLLDGANLDDEGKKMIEDKVNEGMTEDEAFIIANDLRNNQLNPVTHGKQYSVTDAKEAVKRL